VPWTVPGPPSCGTANVYEALLGFDWYIIPPSSVMFRRIVVEDIGGFRNPWGGDDLDFYLRAAWSYPACCSVTPAVTRYRRYSTSSSRDGARMLNSIRAVYQRQSPLVAGNVTLERAYARGLNRLVSIFQDCLVENLTDQVHARQWRSALRSAALLARERPAGLMTALRLMYE
jgi:hypothetical protein